MTDLNGDDTDTETMRDFKMILRRGGAKMVA